ncbi:hypothetical protein C8R46DRAFT_474392 [Mycena filopes]|nr:hypothetical protein C8R46DRAFT_474392 [Mycena filopes]
MSLLPVWYANLDPAYIPTLDVVDAAQVAGDRIDRALGAVYALRALVMLRDRAEGIHTKLWVRTWPWIEFLHIYAESLIGIPLKPELYGIFVAVFVHFQAFGCQEPVESTPGVRAVVGAAWDILIQGTDEKTLRDVSFFLNFDVRKCRPRRLKEYAEGTGGGFEHLACLLRRHVDRAVGDPTIPMAWTGWSHFSSAIGFMAGIKEGQEFRLPFRDALLRQGILGALTAGIISLVPTATEYDAGLNMLTFAFNLVIHYAGAPPGLAWVSELLKSGSLRAFALAVATHQGHDPLDQQLRAYIDVLLTPYMVYRSILLLMPRCLSEAEEFTKSNGFKASGIFPQWQAFYNLVQARLTFLQSSDAAPTAAVKSCDNIECFKILFKSELSRCSTCLDLYYCSRACQSADWRAGHREACGKFSTLRRLPGMFLTVHDQPLSRLKHICRRRAAIHPARQGLPAPPPLSRLPPPTAPNIRRGDRVIDVPATAHLRPLRLHARLAHRRRAPLAEDLGRAPRAPRQLDRAILQPRRTSGAQPGPPPGARYGDSEWAEDALESISLAAYGLGDTECVVGGCAEA